MAYQPHSLHISIGVHGMHPGLIMLFLSRVFLAGCALDANLWSLLLALRVSITWLCPGLQLVCLTSSGPGCPQLDVPWTFTQ